MLYVHFDERTPFVHVLYQVSELRLSYFFTNRLQNPQLDCIILQTMNHNNQDIAYIFSIVVTILVQTANWTC